jgi:hypothetical protein
MGVLRHYKEIESSNPESELVYIKADVDRALREAPLDQEERDVIGVLFLSDPIEYPVRKPNRNGGESGRPLGGTTQQLVGRLMDHEDRSSNARNIRVSRIVKSAAQKIADYLGAGYE